MKLRKENFVLYYRYMRFFTFTVIFHPETDDPDSYWVSVPALPEICTGGSSLEEARFMAQDALELVVLSRLENGEDVPSDIKPAKIPRNAKIEEMVITVFHQVNATPSSYVKTAIFHSA